MTSLAAIDIGSNAVRLAIARDRDFQSDFYISYMSRLPVRLGSSVFSRGNIDEKTYSDLKSALLQFKNQLENHRVKHWRAVATSAMRSAGNNREVIDNLKKETGISVQVITGEEEAHLVSLAISKKIDLNQNSYLLIDIGGGSVELVAIIQGQIIKKESYKVGMVRILEMQKNKKEKLRNWFPEFVKTETRDFFKNLPRLKKAVGTGGNMDRFIKLKSFVSSQSGEFLTLEEMCAMDQMLSKFDYRERIARFCLKPDRADVIVPSAIFTGEIMKWAGCEKIHFPQVGLKDGLLHELSARLKTS